MNNTFLLNTAASLAAVLAAGSALAQISPVSDPRAPLFSPKASDAPPPVPDLDWLSHPRVTLTPKGYANPDRFGLSYRLGLNMSVTFNHLGGYTGLTPANNPLRTAGNREAANYDNGYVYDDAAPPAELTHYYGYVAGTSLYPNNGPVQYGPNLDLYRSAAAGNVSSQDSSGDPQQGLELTYNRQLGRIREGFWGLETGVGFTDVTAADNRQLQSAVSRQTYTFQAAAGAVLTAPAASFPYEGPAPGDEVGWPLVGTSPVSSSAQSFATAATLTGSRSFDAQIITLRFGPYVDVPLNERWTFSFNGGLAVLYINSDFRFTETVTLDPKVTLVSLPPQQSQGGGWHDDWLLGGYVGGNIAFAISDRFRLFTGAQFMSAGDYTHTESGREAVLNLSQTIFVTVGLSCSF